jgi:tetratricopeptide (TPR) repeat protein
MALEENQQKPPVVFISYSHDSAEHADRVLTLSNRLREDGIDCILDQYEESPPEGWPRWMDKHIGEANFVLMICTKRYYDRVMDKEQPGVGKGVRWESTLAYQHVYDAGTKNAKFIPVLFQDGLEAHIPAPLKGVTHYRVDTQDVYELLYRRLTNQPRVRKPDLGKLKKLPPVESRPKKHDFASPAQGTWPGVSLPRGGPKISVPFAGREEELKELTTAMNGDKKVVAVVGMAGQGKSCLIGEWYQRGTRPPRGVGLFWRKVYEAGYTFDRFIDELHLYLAGEPIDRQQIKTIRDRATVVEGLLGAKPCWIVLDGVERWLKRWVSAPDAEAKDLTPDDRAGHDPVLDEFFKDAFFWEGGSRLLLTTRAVPSAIDENPPATIGHRHGREKLLRDLKPEEAIRLLDELDVTGTNEAKREAVTAYGCHAFAVHVLGALLRDWYGGDASRWREVNPLQDHKPASLFKQIIDTCEEDLPLLEFVACSLGPVPVEMLAELTAREETSIRESLAGLKKWQMVEFEGPEADQHTVVRKFLGDRLGRDDVRARRRQIAAWWAQRKAPANPTQIEEIRPLVHAIEHLVAARDPNMATDILFGGPCPESYYTVGDWLRVFGYLDEDIRICELVIDAYIDLIENEGRRELRNDLAQCYNNRGNALAAQGHLTHAIADYGLAIEIREELVEREGRRDLRDALAGSYNNRGTALRIQGHLEQAIADCTRAIEIQQELVDREGRRDLRNALAGSYKARGSALCIQGHLEQGIADCTRAIEIREELVEREGRRDLRNALAGSYNNRGLALAAQDHLPDAIVAYGRAIEIRETLIEREGRQELRSNLETSLFNRAVAQSQIEEWRQAGGDVEKGVALLRTLVQEGQRHVLGSLLEALGFRCRYAKELGDPAKAVLDTNEAMRWFLEEVEQNRMTEPLLEEAAGLAEGVRVNQRSLLQHGLDEALWRRFQANLAPAAQPNPS